MGPLGTPTLGLPFGTPSLTFKSTKRHFLVNGQWAYNVKGTFKVFQLV